MQLAIPKPKFSDGTYYPDNSPIDNSFFQVDLGTRQYVLEKLGQVAAQFIPQESRMGYKDFKLEELPDGYEMYLVQRKRTDKVVKDLVILGHPSESKFRSVQEFIHHLDWLYRDKSHQRENCICRYCYYEIMRKTRNSSSYSDILKKDTKRLVVSVKVPLVKMVSKMLSKNLNEYYASKTEDEIKVDVASSLDVFSNHEAVLQLIYCHENYTNYFETPKFHNVTLIRRLADNSWNLAPLLAISISEPSVKREKLANVMEQKSFLGTSTVQIDDYGVWVSFSAASAVIKKAKEKDGQKKEVFTPSAYRVSKQVNEPKLKDEAILRESVGEPLESTTERTLSDSSVCLTEDEIESERILKKPKLDTSALVTNEMASATPKYYPMFEKKPAEIVETVLADGSLDELVANIELPDQCPGTSIHDKDYIQQFVKTREINGEIYFQINLNDRLILKKASDNYINLSQLYRVAGRKLQCLNQKIEEMDNLHGIRIIEQDTCSHFLRGIWAECGIALEILKSLKLENDLKPLLDASLSDFD